MATRHDRRERERAQRAKQRRRAQGGGGGIRLSGWMTAAIVGGVALLGIFGLRAAGVFDPVETVNIRDVPTAAPNASLGVKEEDHGNAHTSVRGHQVEYPAPLPPTSGAHWDLPHAGWGVKDAPQEDEMVLHNMEHGGVAIQYRPGLDPQALSELKTLVRNLNGQGYPKVLLRPYPDLPKPVVATAWLWRLELDGYDRTQLVQFVQARYGTRGNSPEPNAP